MWTEWFQLYHTNCSAVTPPPETDSFEVLNDPLEDPDLQSQLVFLISLSRLWRCLWRNLTRLFEAINPNIYLTDTRTFSKLTLQRVRNIFPAILKCFLAWISSLKSMIAEFYLNSFYILKNWITSLSSIVEALPISIRRMLYKISPLTKYVFPWWILTRPELIQKLFSTETWF